MNLELARRITRNLAFGRGGVIPHPEYRPEEHGDTEVDFLDFIADTRSGMNNNPATRLTTGPKAQAKGRPRPAPRPRTRSRGHSPAGPALPTHVAARPVAPAQGSAARGPSQGRSVRHRGITPDAWAPQPSQYVAPPWAVESSTPAPEQHGSSGAAGSGSWQGYSSWAGTAWQGSTSQTRPSSRQGDRWGHAGHSTTGAAAGADWGTWQSGTAYRPAPSQAPTSSGWTGGPTTQHDRWSTWDSGSWNETPRKGKRKGR